MDCPRCKYTMTLKGKCDEDVWQDEEYICLWCGMKVKRPKEEIREEARREVRTNAKDISFGNRVLGGC